MKWKIMLVALSAISCGHAYAINSNLINTQTDLSGKVTISVFERIAGSAQQHFIDFAVDVPADFVAIGGGVQGTNYPRGNLLTASYPNGTLTRWLVSTKDHVDKNPVRIKAYAIGLKIAGLTRNQLKSYIAVNVNTSSYVQYPDVSVGVPAGFKMIGGGFKVNWTGAGNIATASYPATSFSWRAKSKDHVRVSPATLQVFAVGIRNNIPGIGQVLVSIDSAGSSFAQHPSSTVNIDYGYALTGCGANVHWSGAGNLLWKLVPSSSGNLHGCTGASKDHKRYSPATITTYGVGMRIE